MITVNQNQEKTVVLGKMNVRFKLNERSSIFV